MDIGSLDPDYDSSDSLNNGDNFNRTTLVPSRNVGKRQAAEIIARQAENRSLFKRNSRRLTFYKGTSGTQASTARVEITWDTFLETLGLE